MMMPPAELTWAAAVMLGLLGGNHCLFMCGGIASGLGMSTANAAHPARLVLLFQFGRIASYTLLGAGLGGLLGIVAGAPVLPVLRLASGLLLIGMGLYLAQWWMGLQWLERGGSLLWQKLQPLTGSLLPVDHPLKALGIGLCWGLLPCGLIYSALAWSAASASAAEAARLMFFFGLGTLPAMAAAGLAGKQFRRLLTHPATRRIAATLLIGFGAWTIYDAATSGHGQHGAATAGQPHHAH